MAADQSKGFMNLASLVAPVGKGGSWADDSEQEVNEKPAAPAAKKAAWGGAATTAPAPATKAAQSWPTLDAAAKVEKAPEPAPSRPSGGFGRDERPRDGGYSRGGYGDDRRGGYGDDRRGGYGDDRRGGYDDDRRGGYGDDRRGGYGDDRRGGYGDDRRGGYGERSYRDERPREPREPREPRAPVPMPDEPPFTAYVGNLAFEATEENIEDLFEGLQIKDVRIVTDRETKRSKGFAYVEFDDQDSLKKAVSMTGEEWNGRALRIDVAQRQERTERRDDRRRGGDGFFGSNRFQNTARDEAPRERPKLNLAPRTVEKPAGDAASGEAAAAKKKEDPFAGAAPKAVRDPFARTEKPQQPREERKPVEDKPAPRREARADDSKAAQVSSWRRQPGQDASLPGRKDFGRGKDSAPRRSGRDEDGWQQQDNGRRGGARPSEGGNRRPQQGKQQEEAPRDAAAGNAFDALADADA